MTLTIFVSIHLLIKINQGMKTRFIYALLLSSLGFCLSSCDKDNDSAAPSVTTGAVNNVTGTGARCTGSVTSPGSTALTAYGVCWSTSANPTIADQHTADSNSPIDSKLSHLNLNTTYHVRAYATNSVGTSYGADVTFTTAAVLSFGDFYAGGLVFYLDTTLLHGYVCSETNQNVNQWGCHGVNVSGANGVAIGTGWANTEAIRLAGCANGYAAQPIYDLTLNGYNDWFLPSKDELHVMYVNLSSIEDFGQTTYWSSTQSGALDAVAVFFSNGYMQAEQKINQHSSRAVRTF
jgi:hypothetical protein